MVGGDGTRLRIEPAPRPTGAVRRKRPGRYLVGGRLRDRPRPHSALAAAVHRCRDASEEQHETEGRSGPEAEVGPVESARAGSARRSEGDELRASPADGPVAGHGGDVTAITQTAQTLPSNLECR